MREFEKFCSTLEKMDRATLDSVMADEAKEAMRGLVRIAGGDPDKALNLLIGAACAAASVDGKLHEGEYRQINGLISALVGKNEGVASFDQVKALIERTVDLDTNDSDYVRAIYVELTIVDQDSAVAFICFLAAMISCDGDASWKERRWLKAVYE